MPFNNYQSNLNNLPCKAILTESPDILSLRLKIQAEPANMLHRLLLAQLYIDSKNLAAAEDILNDVLKLRHDDIFALVSLANIFLSKDMRQEALDLYERAIKHGPLTIKHLTKQLAKLKARGKRPELASVNQTIKDIRGLILTSLCNTGLIHFNHGSRKKAIASLERALEIDSNFIDAHYNIGVIYEGANEPEKAIIAFQKVIDINPDNTSALLGLSNALKVIKKHEQAITHLQRAIAINPEFSDAYTNLGACLMELGHTIEAIDYTQRILKYDPHYVKAWSNLASAYSDLGKMSEADEYFQKALELAPGNKTILKNRALALMKGHNFREAFKIYDLRWMENDSIDRFLPTNRPIWNLQKGQRVFFWAEQGIGDEIMFASMYSEVIPLCSDVIIQADDRLHPLFKRSFGDKVRLIKRTDELCESEYDYHLPIGSLMNFFLQPDNRLDIPQSPYLKPDQARAIKIRKDILGTSTKHLIGISWKTKNPARGIVRSLDLDTFFKSVSTTDRVFVSLQYGDVDLEVAKLAEAKGIKVIQYQPVDNFSDIDGLAALIAACDSVISTTNTTVHLAAAQGKNCQVLIPAASDWRWGLDPTTSYWYSHVRLHRNTYNGDWTEALQSASNVAALPQSNPRLDVRHNS
jgi:tetratricopeptide (TPR) repeat protein